MTPPEIAARLQAARAERAGNGLEIQRLLAGDVAAPHGLSLQEWVGTATDALSDEELRDLASRADSLQTDPVTGGTRKTLIIVGVVVLVVVLLVAAIVESCKEQGAECLN